MITDIANIIPAPITPYEMVARHEANQASILGIAIIGILLLAFAYWPRREKPPYRPPDMHVPLDGRDKPRQRGVWVEGPEFWVKVSDADLDEFFEDFMVVDITDEMDEEE